MKLIFNISIKTLLFVIIVLLIINTFILLTGGIWQITSSNQVGYKINRITGTVYLIAGTEEILVYRTPNEQEKALNDNKRALSGAVKEFMNKHNLKTEAEFREYIIREIKENQIVINSDDFVIPNERQEKGK